MSLPCENGSALNYIPENQLSTLNFSLECNWFDEYNQPYPKFSKAVLDALWQNALPSYNTSSNNTLPSYNASLVYCYDAQHTQHILDNYMDYGYNPFPQGASSVFGIQQSQCCKNSTGGTGDPDVGGVGVSIQQSCHHQEDGLANTEGANSDVDRLRI
jgi:hypothetical protein